MLVLEIWEREGRDEIIFSTNGNKIGTIKLIGIFGTGVKLGFEFPKELAIVRKHAINHSPRRESELPLTTSDAGALKEADDETA